MEILLSIIAFLTEGVKFTLKLGKLPVGELEFIALIGELLSGKCEVGFKSGDATTQFGNIFGAVLNICLQLSYLVIQFSLLPFKICNHGRKTFHSCFSLLDLVFKSTQLLGFVAYNSFEFGILAVKVSIVFSGRAMACAGLVNVIATVKAVFAVHFGKASMQISHVLLRFDFVLASNNFL